MPAQNPEPGHAADRKPGRPRDPEVRRRILEATDELLGSVGYLELTMDGVASHAGVSRKTLYHWWPSKAALVGELMVDSAIVDEVPDVGSTREELLILIGQILRDTDHAENGSLLPMLWAKMGDPVVMERFRQEVLGPRRRFARAAVQRGIARGDLPADTDVDLLVDSWSGTVFFRREMRGEPVYDDQAEQMVDLALSGAVPRLPGSGRPRPAKPVAEPGGSQD
jgi:AcrR family transcriptional regulator